MLDSLAKLDKKVVNVISIAIPVVVALLLGIQQKMEMGAWTKTLPHLNAVINGSTAILLLAGFIAIRKGHKDLHKKLMLSALSLGSVFLVSYVLYHFSNPSTHFGGTDTVKYLYYILLLSHIVLAAVVVYFVLMAVYYALRADWIGHKSMVRWAWPIWFYVSVTGVLVYLMIRPYYS
jgi:putative membrane protein